MFGFLKPTQFIPQWRRSYARVCQYQRKLFGLSSLPFLSYEATLLYQLLSDLGEIPSLDENQPTCCRLRRLSGSPQADEKVGTYSAAFGVVLAGIKLDDDVRDSGRLAMRILRRKYRRQVDKARKALDSIAPGSTDAIDSAVESHLKLEASTVSNLDDYLQPTGNGFCSVFAGCSTQHATLLGEVGMHVGKAIIAWDCAVDYERDRIRGEFTPLQSQQDVDASFAKCLRELGHLGWKLPPASVSREVVASVVHRVQNRMRTPTIEPVKLLERWGFIRQRGFTYAGCDGCEAICGITECCGGVAEAGACCGEVGAADATCCASDFACCCVHPNSGAVCYDCGGTTKKEPTAQQQNNSTTTGNKSPYGSYVGQYGIATTLLNPMGQVLINDQTIPAKVSTSRLISEGTYIRVVDADDFGVVVSDTQKLAP
ncbi:MAG: DUF5685 family protein [Planctomycetaceae bacterium]